MDCHGCGVSCCFSFSFSCLLVTKAVVVVEGVAAVDGVAVLEM